LSAPNHGMVLGELRRHGNTRETRRCWGAGLRDAARSSLSPRAGRGRGEGASTPARRNGDEDATGPTNTESAGDTIVNRSVSGNAPSPRPYPRTRGEGGV
jgi:hypothetical protein